VTKAGLISGWPHGIETATPDLSFTACHRYPGPATSSVQKKIKKVHSFDEAKLGNEGAAEKN